MGGRFTKKVISLVAAAVLIAAAVAVTVSLENKKAVGLEAGYVSEVEAARAEADSLNERILELEAAAEAERAEADALNAEIQAIKAERQADAEVSAEVFRSFDYQNEPVYVIGHAIPDSDTVASAIGMAYLLDALGIDAEARVAGALNLESEYGFSAVGCATPQILENAAGSQLWLVDHSSSAQMVSGADEARIVGITDHHGIGDVKTSDLINVLSVPACSDSSVVFMLFERCGVEIPQEVAKALMVGLLSDTANMKSKSVNALDEAAFAGLREISGISDTNALFDGMLEAKLSYKGMDDREIFYSDYKRYETAGFCYGIGNIKVAHPEQVPEMAERMLKVIRDEAENGSDTDFLLFEVYDSEYALGYLGYFGNDAELTGTVMDTAFGASGEKKGDFFAFSPSLSRKTDIVPPIDDCLSAISK